MSLQRKELMFLTRAASKTINRSVSKSNIVNASTTTATSLYRGIFSSCLSISVYRWWIANVHFRLTSVEAEKVCMMWSNSTKYYVWCEFSIFLSFATAVFMERSEREQMQFERENLKHRGNCFCAIVVCELDALCTFNGNFSAILWLKTIEQSGR